MMPTLNIEDFSDLREYLCSAHYIMSNEEVLFETLPGGISNRTVLVKRNNNKSIVLKQPLEKLRVAVSWFSNLERIHIEAKALRWLQRLVASKAIPTFVFEDFDNHILAMEAVPGERRTWKSLLLQGIIQPDHFKQFGTLIGTIHRRAFERASELADIFPDQSFFESLRLEPYYLYTAQQIPDATKFLVSLVHKTRECRMTLVHGDYSPKNILISEGKLVLLDYEVVHFGDPAFDLGFSLTHFLSKAHRFPDRRTTFLVAANLYWQTYKDTTADSPISDGLEVRVIDHLLGCLLARVAGRSPLEYLDPEQRRKQEVIACSLMQKHPSLVSDVISQFGEALEKDGKN